MRRITWLVVLLAACGRRHADLTIAITADGFVKVEGKAVTLDQLGALLAVRRERGPRERVWETEGASALPVFLDPDDDAAWQRVGWVMTILAEQKFWRFSFPGGRNALQADTGIWPTSAEPDGEALLTRILVREGGTYVLGDRATGDLAELGRWIDAAPKGEYLCRIGGLRADPRAKWRDVRVAFDLLRARGVRRIEFTDGIPTRAARLQSPLPAPSGQMVDASWSGMFVVNYLKTRDVYEEPSGIEEAPEPEER